MSKCFHCINWGNRCTAEHPLETYEICECYERFNPILTISVDQGLNYDDCVRKSPAVSRTWMVQQSVFPKDIRVHWCKNNEAVVSGMGGNSMHITFPAPDPRYER